MVKDGSVRDITRKTASCYTIKAHILVGQSEKNCVITSVPVSGGSVYKQKHSGFGGQCRNVLGFFLLRTHIYGE